VVLGAIGLALAIAATATIVLLNRDSGGSAEPSPSGAPVPTSAQRPSFRPRPVPSAAPAPSRPGWRSVTDEFAGLRYELPRDWTRPTRPAPAAGATFNLGVEYGTYECGSSNFFRGLAASTTAPTGGDLAAAVSTLARALGEEYYANPRIDVGNAVDVERGGARGASVTARITVPDPNECSASAALVGVVAIETDRAVLVLTVVSDLAGGPVTPAPAPESVVEEILATAHPL